MTTASVRLYGELNDSLHPFVRQQQIILRCQEESTVQVLITTLGIPNTDVDLIIVNGNSVDFSYVVQAQDQISIYPLFRSIDISPIKKVRLLN